MRAMLRRFIRDEEAATAIEYALIAGIIAGILITAITALGGGITEIFDDISEALKGAVTTTQ